MFNRSYKAMHGIADPKEVNPVEAAKKGDIYTLKKYIENGQVDKDFIDPNTKLGLLHHAAIAGQLDG